MTIWKGKSRNELLCPMHTSKEKKAILCNFFSPVMSLALKLFTQNLTQIGRIQ